MDENNFEEMLRKMQEHNDDKPAEDNSAEDNSIFDFSNPAPKAVPPVPNTPAAPEESASAEPAGDFFSFMNGQDDASESQNSADGAENPFDFFQTEKKEVSKDVPVENPDQFSFLSAQESESAAGDLAETFDFSKLSAPETVQKSPVESVEPLSFDIPKDTAGESVSEAAPVADDFLSFLQSETPASAETAQSEESLDIFDIPQPQDAPQEVPVVSESEEFMLSDPIETNAPDDTYFDFLNKESNSESQEVPQNDSPEDVFGFPIHEDTEEAVPEVGEVEEVEEVEEVGDTPDEEGVTLMEDTPEEIPVEGTAPVEETVLVEEEAAVALADRLVRFPESDYVCRLGDLIDESTGAPLDLDALFPAPAAASAGGEEYAFSMPGTAQAETPSFNAGGFAPSAASEGSSSAPRRVVRRAPKKKASAVKLIFSVILGGLLAFPLAHYLGITIQKYVMKTDQPQGIMALPTPGFPETYRYAKRYSWLPAPVKEWFLANAVNPPKPEEEEESTPVPSIEETEEETTPAVKVPAASEEIEETEEEMNGDFHVGDYGEVEVANEGDSDLSGLFGQRPGEDAAPAVEVPVVEAPTEGKLTSAQLVALASQADEINPKAEAAITKENHDMPVVFVGKVVKVASSQGFHVVKVQLDGSESTYFVVSKEAMDDIAKGVHCVVSGIVKSPDSDPTFTITKDASPVVLRELMEILP